MDNTSQLCKKSATTRVALHGWNHQDAKKYVSAHSKSDFHEPGEGSPLSLAGKLKSSRSLPAAIVSFGVRNGSSTEEGFVDEEEGYGAVDGTAYDDGGGDGIGKGRGSYGDVLADEARSMIKLALPVVGTYLLEMLPGPVSIMLVGHVKSPHAKEYIDACGLAVIFIYMTGLSLGFGMASAMDTLCSQAYGAGEIHRMGTYVQTGMIVLGISFVFVFLLNYNAATVLIWLGQPEEISELTGTFTRYLIPGIPFLYMYELVRKVLQAQNIALPMLYVAVAANVINAGLGYYLVYHTNAGWLGSAMARTAAHMSFFFLMVPYLYFTGIWRKSWVDGWQPRAAWRGIRQFVGLGIPGALQLCFEWWAFEFLALIAGLLPNAVLAIGTDSILLIISSMVYMLYLGISIAGNVRIGNALGAGLPQRAALASNLTIALGLFCSVLAAAFLVGFRSILPALFTSDPDMIEYSSQLLYIVAAFQAPDALMGAVQGILKGSGRQKLGAYLNFVGYYVVGMPCALVLAFHAGWSLMGLWMGMTMALFVVGCGGTFIIARSDWALLAEEAIERVNE